MVFRFNTNFGVSKKQGFSFRSAFVSIAVFMSLMFARGVVHVTG
jgi:hypothetical protein